MATTPTHGTELRGSQKLLHNLVRNGDTPSLDEIRKALAFPANMEFKVPNWLVRGVPPAYLTLDATLQVPIAHLNDVVNRFVKLSDSSINMKILINGIPVPDIATIEIRNTPEVVR